MNKRFKFAPLVGTVGALVAGASHAAMPEGFATAVSTYSTDVVAAIGLLIAAGIAVFAAKRLGQKLGLL